MSRIIYKSISDIAAEAGTPNPDDPGTGYMIGPYAISETLWGLKQGVYSPIVDIALPVQIHLWESNGEREAASATLFSYDFFNGEGLMYESFERIIEGRETKPAIGINHRKASVEEAIREHIGLFFRKTSGALGERNFHLIKKCFRKL